MSLCDAEFGLKSGGGSLDKAKNRKKGRQRKTTTGEKPMSSKENPAGEG